jgi:hypothetical protein
MSRERDHIIVESKHPADLVAMDVPLPDVPYPGIEPFGFVDQQIFAARDAQIWALLSNITLYRAVLLYGDSGTGKSSLINAGLLPAILHQNYIPDRLRIQPFAKREIKVERIKKSGGAAPTYMSSSFGLLAVLDDNTMDETGSVELSLRDFRRRLKELEASSVRPTSDPESDKHYDGSNGVPRLLLVFDQFEEFITLFEEAQRSNAARSARVRQEVIRVQRRILVTLVKLIRNPKLPVRIIFAFREDHLAKLSPFFQYCPELLDQGQRLLPPAVKDIPEIVRAPFASAKLRAHFSQQEGKAGSELNQELAEQIALELSKSGEVNLTELQIVCLRLWQSAEPQKLFAELGVERLVQDYGEEVVNGFPVGLRQPALALLSRMITQSNTRNVIEEQDLFTAAAKEEPFPPDLLKQALDRLVTGQLVRRETRRRIYFYELTSEYLVSWIKRRREEREATASRYQVQRVFQQLGPLREPAVAVLEYLLTPSKTRIVLSEADLIGRIRSHEKIPVDELRAALHELASTPLIRREMHDNQYCYEIASDYLVPWIRERITLEQASALRTSFRRARRRLFSASLFLFVCVLALGLIGYFYKKDVEKNRQLLIAQHEKQEAQTQALINERLKQRYESAFKVVAATDDNEKLKAIAQIEEWIGEKDFPSELPFLLYVAQSRTDSARVKEALAKLLIRAAQANPNLSQSIVTASETNEGLAEKLPPRFYIHIADERQSGLANIVAEKLGEKGWGVPAIQVASGNPPYWDNELRYFRKLEPNSLPQVKEIVSLLEKSAGGKWVDKYVPGYANSPRVQPGYFEIWFAALKGTLFVSLVDEDGRKLERSRMTLKFLPRYGIGLGFNRSRNGPGFIDVPPGNYDVIISVSGYKDLTVELSMEAEKVITWTDLKMMKERSPAL